MFTAMRDDDKLCFLKKCGPSAVDSVEKKEGADEKPTVENGTGKLPFPSLVDLNARMRRLMTLYQRMSRYSASHAEANRKKNAKAENMQSLLAEKELKRLTDKQRWSRRDELDFYRTLVSYGELLID